MSSRRKARECALQMLYQWDLGKDSPENVEHLFWTNTRLVDDEELRAFAGKLFHGTTRMVRELDALIVSHAENWRMDRMAAVDRNLLRLGAYELVYEKDTPPAVVINEALEIARRYSGDESVHFLNGLLDSIRKQQQPTQTT
jgi:N utilization substance protein B